MLPREPLEEPGAARRGHAHVRHEQVEEKNGSNSRRFVVSLMPIPLSLTASITQEPGRTRPSCMNDAS